MLFCAFLGLAFLVVWIIIGVKNRLDLIRYLNIDMVSYVKFGHGREGLEAAHELMMEKLIEKDLLMLYRLRRLIEKGRELRMLTEEDSSVSLSKVQENIDGAHKYEVEWPLLVGSFEPENKEEEDFQLEYSRFQKDLEEHKRFTKLLAKDTSITHDRCDDNYEDENQHECSNDESITKSPS